MREGGARTKLRAVDVHSVRSLPEVDFVLVAVYRPGELRWPLVAVVQERAL